MLRRHLRLIAVIGFCSTVCSLSHAAGPRVDIIASPGAPSLEQRAVTELTALLKQLFDAEIKAGADASPDAAAFFLTGSPATNPAVKEVMGANWPKLSEQGHLVRSVRWKNRPAVVLGGGSPAATLWAVSEFGHHFGMRSLLHRDFAPLEKPEFKLEGLDLVREPRVATRGFQILDDDPTGFAGWGLADQKQLLRQLARMKFNRVVLRLAPTQPFLPASAAPDSSQACALFGGSVFPVSGDTPGRAVFRGAKQFENPDFAGLTGCDECRTAGIAYLRGLVEEARTLGLSAGVMLNPAAGSSAESQKALMDALLSAVPGLERLSVSGSVIALREDSPGLLPQIGLTRVAAEWQRAAASKDGSVTVTATLAGDLNPAAYFVARAAFLEQLTPEAALDDLVTPICGPGVVDRLRTGFAKIDQASVLVRKNFPEAGSPRPEMLRHVAQSLKSQPSLEWVTQARTNYTDAMNEMYRANTRARDGARQFTLYYAKRFESALHWMTALEATHKAERAEAGSDDQIAQREAAVEAMYNALSAFGEVARDQSDRGTIAVLNEYGYRPLVKALEE